MCYGISGASFVAISEGHIRIFCSSALSEFLTAATFVERITCFKVILSFGMLFSVTSASL